MGVGIWGREAKEKYRNPMGRKKFLQKKETESKDVQHLKFLQASFKIFSSYPVGWREVPTLAFQG